MQKVASLRKPILVVLLLGALTSAGLLFIDRYAPRDRIVSGGRIRVCGLFGGSWPADISGEVGLASGASLDRFGTASSGGDHHLVAARVRDGAGRILGVGVWNVGDNVPAERRGAVDGLAHQVSSRHSPLGVTDHVHEVAAARECSQRDLPRRARRRPPTG